ncbi:MAG: CHAP domain-containing protein [Actinobacteria bacterium]|nr:CHAP domain-containing protein [Actinomycetota bacterium]
MPITRAMSFDLVMARVSELQALISPPARPPAGPAAAGGQSFQALLAQAGASAGPAAAQPPAGATGATIVAAVQGEVGQAEQPPGSNDSPRIAEYRTATAGSGVGPWCAYFVSWAAKQAGTPVGEQGQGFGSVDALYAWAQRTGRATPASAGQPPSPGDLIVWDEHIGIVESVLPDGRIQTIEGNSSDQVSRRVHAPGSALGYVRLG